ncbi:MAG: transposase [Akkermansia sp.]
MTEHIQSTTDSPLINMIFHYGLAEEMPKIAEIIINASILIERTQHLQADSYQRSPERTGYANGFKKKSLLTSMSKLDLQGARVDQTLKLSIAEMYLQGINTRKASKVLRDILLKKEEY